MKTCIKTNAPHVNTNFSKRLQFMTILLVKKLETIKLIYMWVCFVGDNNKNNIEVILISTLVSGSVLTLVIVITIYLFWRSKREQRYLLLQIHESK